MSVLSSLFHRRPVRRAGPIVLAAALFGAAAQAYAASLVPASLYECVGREVTARYSADAFGPGVPEVVITLGAEVIKARGANVRVHRTALGSLVTVRQASVPDSHTDSLTLLAPDVNVPVIVDKAPSAFLTTLFSTRTLTSVGGSGLVPGVIQQSGSQPVMCTPSAPSAQSSQ